MFLVLCSRSSLRCKFLALVVVERSFDCIRVRGYGWWHGRIVVAVICLFSVLCCEYFSLIDFVKPL